VLVYWNQESLPKLSTPGLPLHLQSSCCDRLFCINILFLWWWVREVLPNPNEQRWLQSLNILLNLKIFCWKMSTRIFLKLKTAKFHVSQVSWCRTYDVHQIFCQLGQLEKKLIRSSKLSLLVLRYGAIDYDTGVILCCQKMSTTFLWNSGCPRL
jgi:hypothetical protein